MTIQESNKLIAEFMGMTERIPKPTDYNQAQYYSIPHRGNSSYTHLNQLNYHESWDWLMPVIEKIESIREKDNTHYGVSVEVGVCGINAYRNLSPKLLFLTANDDKMSATYQTVIKFIEWYNERTNR